MPFAGPGFPLPGGADTEESDESLASEPEEDEEPLPDDDPDDDDDDDDDDDADLVRFAEPLGCAEAA